MRFLFKEELMHHAEELMHHAMEFKRLQESSGTGHYICWCRMVKFTALEYITKNSQHTIKFVDLRVIGRIHRGCYYYELTEDEVRDMVLPRII